MLGIMEEERSLILGEEVWGCMFADDTVLVYTDRADALSKLDMVEDFCLASAFKINRSKTEAVGLVLPEGVVEPAKFFGRGTSTILLGAPVGIDGLTHEYWKSKMEGIKKEMLMWKRYGLSIFQKAHICRVFFASRLQYAFNFGLMPDKLVTETMNALKAFVFGKYMPFRPVESQAKAKACFGGVGLVDIGLQNRATMSHWIVRIGGNRESKWKRILLKGYHVGSSIIMDESVKAAGNKCASLMEGMRIKDIRDSFDKGWKDDQFVGWKDVQLPSKWVEFRWRIQYSKLKLAKQDYAQYFKCLWCEEVNSKLHLFNQCKGVEDLVREWGAKCRIMPSREEWIADRVNRSQVDWKAREFIMTSVKWGIWRSYASRTYGKINTPIKISINNALKETIEHLQFRKDFNTVKQILNSCK